MLFRLLEVVLKVAPRKIYTQVYAKCFINRLPTLSLNREANFAVQKLIKYCQEKSEVFFTSYNEIKLRLIKYVNFVLFLTKIHYSLKQFSTSYQLPSELY